MQTYFKRLSNNNSIFLENQRYACGSFLNDNLALKFVFSGSKSYKMNGRTLTVYPDSFLAINKDTCFESSILCSENVRALSVSFSADFIKDTLSSLIKPTDYLLDNFSNKDSVELCFPESLFPVKLNLKFNLKHIGHFMHTNLNDDNLLEEYLHHTFINYAEIVFDDVLFMEDRLNCRKKNTKMELIRRLRIAKDFMYCNYNQSITLNEIAENSCLSVNHLLRTFKQVFGETPCQFLTKVRLIRANDLLKNSLYPLNEVVVMVGFECASSFIRLYKSHFNQTPGRFRFDK